MQAPYVPEFVIKWSASVLARLPLRLTHLISTGVGWCVWLSRSRPRRVTEINVALCFPDLSQIERRTLARASVFETAKTFSDSIYVWHRPVEQTREQLFDSESATLLASALRNPQGLIVVSPHVGCWELCTLAVSKHTPFTYFYRSPRNPALDPLLIKWRGRLGGQAARLDAGGIRNALKRLKQGETVGILPDQEPDPGAGVFAPFFGTTALTMTLLTRLAQRSGATVLYCMAERLPASRGWRMHYLQADERIRHADPVIAATEINRMVEQCVAIAPAQYLWDYRRMRTLPDGSRRSYRENPESLSSTSGYQGPKA